MDFMTIVARNTTDHVNIEGIIEDLGIELERSVPLDPEINGRMRPNDTGGWIMELNSEDSELRKRFTLAHMVGHWILHRPALGAGLNEGFDFKQDLLADFYNPMIEEREETEANVFAAELLVPKELVMPLIEDPDLDPEAAARTLRCSAAALNIRLELFQASPDEPGLERLLM